MIVKPEDCRKCVASNESGLCRLYGGWTALRGRECATYTPIERLAELLGVGDKA